MHAAKVKGAETSDAFPTSPVKYSRKRYTVVNKM
jgi:hypothetical protein